MVKNKLVLAIYNSMLNKAFTKRIENELENLQNQQVFNGFKIQIV